MGHIFTNNSVKIDPGKVNDVIDMPKPEDVEGVQRVNGFLNCLAKFLPKLADVMGPTRKIRKILATPQR